jgi:hypothetical protein
VSGDDLPEDFEALPKMEELRAGVKGRASPDARPDGAQEPHGSAENVVIAYKACNRARVQEGIKDPPPPTEDEPEETGNPDDHIIGEGRDLFAHDAMEGR